MILSVQVGFLSPTRCRSGSSRTRGRWDGVGPEPDLFPRWPTGRRAVRYRQGPARARRMSAPRPLDPWLRAERGRSPHPGQLPEIGRKVAREHLTERVATLSLVRRHRLVFD